MRRARPDHRAALYDDVNRRVTRARERAVLRITRYSVRFHELSYRKNSRPSGPARRGGAAGSSSLLWDPGAPARRGDAPGAAWPARAGVRVRCASPNPPPGSTSGPPAPTSITANTRPAPHRRHTVAARRAPRRRRRPHRPRAGSQDTGSRLHDTTHTRTTQYMLHETTHTSTTLHDGDVQA